MDPKQSMATTGRAPFLRSMRITLLAWFVLLALTPMALVSIISYTRAQKALTESAWKKVVSKREGRKDVILTLFDRWRKEILFVSHMEALKSDIADMAVGFNFLGSDRLRSLYSAKPDLMDAGDGSAYSAVHQEEHKFFKNYTNIQQHEDVLLMDPTGNVIYTEQKGPDFGVSLTSGPYADTNLARLFHNLKAAKPGAVLMADAALFENSVAMFMGTPVFRGDVCLGYLAFQLPLKYLSQRVGRHEGMSHTGEVYLVGSDLRLRSDTFNDPAGHNLKASFAGTVEKNGVDTEAVRKALAGKTGVCVITDYRGKKVLSAYAPLSVNGLHWAILSEIDMQEALAPTTTLAKITAGLAIAVTLIVFVLSMFASNRISRPVRSLTDWSRQVADGDLTLVEIAAPKNEIGVLTESFRETVKSLRTAQSEQERQNWQKTGRANLDDQMRGEQDPETLCRNIIAFIAKYLKAQVGAFYLNNEGVFNLKASYAYKTRKNLSNKFKTGEGLIGQAAMEKQSILLTDVPEDYIAISSGLGEKPPRNILVMPLVFNNSTLGVIEIGAFEAFSEDHRIFLEENSERISIALYSAFARQRLQKALEVTQRQAEEMEAQQEELRVSNEELEDQARALKESEEKLKSQQEELQVTNEELEEKTESLERQKQKMEEANHRLEQAKAEIEKRAAEVALASKYKSEFLANMSHELRTPLNSLLLLSNSLANNKEGTLTEEQVESARVIYDSGNQLLSLINEILDLAKIEAGRMELHLETVGMDDLVNTIRDRFAHMAKEKNIGFDIVVSETVPREIETDRKKVEQIIWNLISNALKFTGKGEVLVSFARAEKGVDPFPRGLTPSNTLKVSIKDTGIGIPLDKQKIIFEAFQQADGTTARRYGGTGLGLSISRGLIRMLGGEIRLKSAEGKGSTFTLYLPIEAGKVKPEKDELRFETRKLELETAPDPSADTLAQVSRFNAPASIADDREALEEGDKTILVIEDDARFAKVLLKHCHEKGFKCLASSTGEEGLTLAAKYLPQGIILDIRLPGMNGWAVLEVLKSDPDLRHIPVHIMSVEDPNIEAFKKGAIGFLNKPAKLEALEQVFSKFEDILSRKIKTLLVVEDDDNLRRHMLHLIGNGDVHLDEAATGREALDALRSTRYDCIILDLGLPDMSGFDLLKALEEDGSVTVPPVIVHTAGDLTRDQEIKLRQYAESIIIKGVKSDERLLDEASLFLHRIVGKMPSKQRRMIIDLHDIDAQFRGKKILMVDDDMRNVFALAKILEERGLQVIKAEDGRRALEVLEKQPDVDLVLMDIMMPVMDGYEAMQRIRSQTKFHRLPIIALTAKAMTGDKEKCIEAGANDYLAKPVDVKRLLSMLRVWLYR